ncbi:MAG: hypothetical protein QOD83_4404 [Solirubrobacteraceae bacterium]|jgi:hypothetical protein|nr:hypothetical protein [Solirubrobacteraceae bacterium]
MQMRDRGLACDPRGDVGKRWAHHAAADTGGDRAANDLDAAENLPRGKRVVVLGSDDGDAPAALCEPFGDDPRDLGQAAHVGRVVVEDDGEVVTWFRTHKSSG